MGMEERLKKLARSKGMSGSDVAAAIDFVMDAIQEHIDYTEEHESYATNSIERMRAAYYVVSDLQDFFFS